MSYAGPLKAPFPWFGGKSRISKEVWARFGDCANYVEPFFGSGAVLLARPADPGIETVNDIDGMICNFWRSIQHDPDATAEAADWPVNEIDCQAREAWLVPRRAELTDRLLGDPDYYDTKIAGWWAYGICAHIGGGYCSGTGPWQSVDGMLVKTKDRGINRQLPHLGKGRGINRKLPHLGNAGRGINRQLPHLGNAGRGINRQPPHLGNAGLGVNNLHSGTAIRDMFRALQARLRNVRVCCGDWTRVCGPSVTINNGLTGVFLDPPYSADAGRDRELYACENLSVAHDVREWALANGDDPLLRIALCGYEGEHAMPDSWECIEWKAKGGYGGQKKDGENVNAHRERVWFSPACLGVEKQGMLAI